MQIFQTLSKKVIFSCFLACMLEIYDFVIFGFLLTTFHKNYLSFLDKETAQIVTYAFFAVGFLFRPLGSLIFGYIGDVYGRKKALITSVSMMGGASFLMFILPPYSSIGIVSCYLIVLVRIVQGISVGGEFTGALVFAIEHNKRNIGIVGGIITAGGSCGVLLASLVSRILQNPNLPEYSWRFAFLLGFSLALVGYFIRTSLSDSPLFKKYKEERIPLFAGLKILKTESMAALFVAAANGTTFYFGTVYLVKFIQEIRGDNLANFIPTLVGLTVVITVPFFGMLSDLINRAKFLIYSTMAMGCYSLVAMWIIANTNSLYILGVVVFIYALLSSLMVGAVNIFAIEIFPVRYRMSCSSLFYSLGMGFIGGTVPIVSSYIVSYFGANPIFLGMYISFICFLATFSVFLVYTKQSKTKKIIDLSLNLNNIEAIKAVI